MPTLLEPCAELLKSGDGWVFCSEHVPPAAQAVVWLVPPLGQLYYRCHWFYRQLTQALVKQGYAVVRMDFRGQGDASGDFQQITEQSLVEDLLSVYIRLRLRHPHLPLWMVATDWSVVPVLQFCAQQSVSMKLWGLILAEPVLHGADYWQQQLNWQQAMLKEPLRFRSPRQLASLPDGVALDYLEPDYIEIVGHAYAQAWVQQIQATDGLAYLGNIACKHRVCIAGEQRLLPIKNYLTSQSQPRIQDHFTQLQAPPAWYDAAKLDQSVQHAQWLHAIPDYIQQLR